MLAVPAGHALAAQKSVLFADTLTCDYIGLHETSAIHSFLNRIAAEMNRTIKPRIQVGNFEGACRMVEAKVGIAILPASAARRYRQTMDIQIVSLKDEWAMRQLHICVRSIDLLPAFARDLIKLLREDAETSQVSGAA